MEKLYYYIIGIVTGACNGLFGSGGGMLAVPMLEHTKKAKQSGGDPKMAHSTAIAITLPLSVASTAIYSLKEAIDFPLALKFIPFGLLGAYVGSKLLKRLASSILKKAFACMLIISGIRLILG